MGGLLETTPGSFFGTTENGAAANGGGTVFHLIVPPAPRFQAYGRSGNSFMLSWSTVTNQTYQLQYKTNLTQGSWNNLGAAIPCTNSTSTVYDPLVPGPGRVAPYRATALSLCTGRFNRHQFRVPIILPPVFRPAGRPQLRRPGQGLQAFRSAATERRISAGFPLRDAKAQ